MYSLGQSIRQPILLLIVGLFMNVSCAPTEPGVEDETSVSAVSNVDFAFRPGKHLNSIADEADESDLQNVMDLESQLNPSLYKKRYTSFGHEDEFRDIDVNRIVQAFLDEGYDENDIEVLWRIIKNARGKSRLRRSVENVSANRTDTNRRPQSSNSVQPIESSTRAVAVNEKRVSVKSGNIRKKSIEWSDYAGYDKQEDVPQGTAWNRQLITKEDAITDMEVAIAAALEALGDYENGIEEDLPTRFANAQPSYSGRDHQFRTGKQRTQKRYFSRVPNHGQAKHRGSVAKVDYDVNQCPVMKRIISTCQGAEVLMGGYRQLLSEACLRYEACSLCERNQDVCDRNYRRHSVALCGPDLLCRSQSQRVAWGLGDIHEVVDDLGDGSFHVYSDRDCSEDPCVARYLKRR